MDDNEPETEKLLDALIAFDTTSRNSNLALIDFVAEYLDGHGVASRRVHDDAGGKANLIATIGPDDRAGLVLSGHTDVVPVDGQDWSSDPFRAGPREGSIYGRGAADMKGFLAVVMASVPAMRRVALKRPFHLAFSYDEEIGCLGVPRLIDDLTAHLPVRPYACLVGEPTSMRIADGHKGKAGMRCTVIGLEAHSALPHRGVNAVMIAAEIIAHISQRQRDLLANGPFADGYTPPCSTAGVGRIEGGSQLNIIPNHCSFEFEFRALPDQDALAMCHEVRLWAESELLPAMRAVSPDAGFTWEELMAYPGLGQTTESDFERLCRRLTGTERPDKVSFGTEAGHFAHRGIPSLVCGPGDIAVAHKPDEYVELTQLRLCETFIAGLITDAAA